MIGVISEKNKQAIIVMIILFILFASIFSYLYFQQREIDSNLGTVKGTILSYKMSSIQSGMRVEYVYEVKGEAYKEYAFTGRIPKYLIDYDKKYLIEYSTKDPNVSRIIIGGKTYNRGVD